MNKRNNLLKQSLVLALPVLLAASLSEASAHDAELRREFADPPLRHQSRPLWFWNGKLDAEKTKGMVTACKAAGYYGMGILRCNGMGLDFMSLEFLKQYRVAMDEAGVTRLGHIHPSIETAQPAGVRERSFCGARTQEGQGLPKNPSPRSQKAISQFKIATSRQRAEFSAHRLPAATAACFGEPRQHRLARPWVRRPGASQRLTATNGSV